MIGPVLYQEMLLGARRNRAYFFRWFYAGWIVLQLSAWLFFAWTATLAMRQPFDSSALADFCRDYLEAVVIQHYLVLLLATPVLAAGAITDEKSRGTLQYLLVTDLQPWEILVGKLIGRLYQVFLIALTPLPVICFLGVFGGLDLLMLLSLCISSLAMAFAIGSMSLLASVLCRHTRDAVLGLYTVGALFYLGAAILHNALASYVVGGSSLWLRWLDLLLNCLDQLHPMGSGWSLDNASERSLHLAASIVAWDLVGLVSLGLAVLNLRTSYLRYLERADKKRWWPVLLVFACAWSALGIVALVVFLVATGQANSYLDGTSRQHWIVALLLFMLAWNAVGLAPLLGGIMVLKIKGRSHAVLLGLHDFLTRSWLTRRAGISGDPLRWKERHVEGVAPLAFLRTMPRWLGMAIIFLTTTASSLFILAEHLGFSDSPGTVVKTMLAGDMHRLMAIYGRMFDSASGFYSQGFVVMLLAGLVIAIRCSGAVTGEREKSTWEALLLTPLETRQLIRGKLWGIIGASIPYLIAYALPAMTLGLIGGTAALFWAALWTAVTLLAMIFVGAAGLWCSVRAKSSWRSLLGTLGITYVGGFVLFCVTSPIMVLVALLLFIMAMLAEKTLGINLNVSFGDFLSFFSVAMCITLAGAFAMMAWRFVVGAEYRVGVLERTKHWRDEPKHPRWSRHARERRREKEQRRPVAGEEWIPPIADEA